MKVLALDDVSLEVSAGEVYGFLGANGAGKSTTIRTLLNFIQPSSGSATIAGYDIVEKSMEVKRHVGYLAGDVALYNNITGARFLDYMAALQPLPDPSYRDRLVQDFEADLNKPLGTLSKGNRQKIGIIQAFMHQPTVLILDEPTSGLDPLMQEVFFDAVHDAKERGSSVFFSSHNLAEVQRICDRIGFIRQGKLVREQSLAELALSAAHTFDVAFTDAAPLADLRKIASANVTAGSDKHHVSLSVPASSLQQFFKVLAAHDVAQFQQREVNLEEEFLNFYREEA
jgi:ABC-2 type transport system ATP-binding protein